MDESNGVVGGLPSRNQAVVHGWDRDETGLVLKGM